MVRTHADLVLHAASSPVWADFLPGAPATDKAHHGVAGRLSDEPQEEQEWRLRALIPRLCSAGQTVVAPLQGSSPKAWETPTPYCLGKVW